MAQSRTDRYSFLGDEGGPTAVEYAVMLLIIAAALLAIGSLGSATAKNFQNTVDQLNAFLGS